MRITPTLFIDEAELSEQFMRASGPGGQNVNKVETAVQLRFDAAQSSALSEPVRKRLIALAGTRATKDGVIIISAQRHRTREQNRQDARDRLADLIARAARPPRPRLKTRPTLAAKRRRLDEKKRRGEIKAARARPLAGRHDD